MNHNKSGQNLGILIDCNHFRCWARDNLDTMTKEAACMNKDEGGDSLRNIQDSKSYTSIEGGVLM